MQNTKLLALFFVLLIIIAFLIEDSEEKRRKRRKRLCKYVKRRDSCRDIRTKKDRRKGRPGRCTRKGGGCELSGRKGKRNKCVCVFNRPDDKYTLLGR